MTKLEVAPNWRPTSEEELVALLLQHLSRLLGRRQRIACEVRTHGRARTDVCMLDQGELVAIEVKLSHWRRAIGQALLNTYYADRSYIALWDDAVSDVVVQSALIRGIGVIGVGRTDAKVVSEAPIGCPDEALRARVLARTFAT